MQETKKCEQCGSVLPISEFYKRTRNKDGHMNMCKKCYGKLYLKKDKVDSQKELDKMLNIKGKTETSLPEKSLSSYTPRDLIDELRMRGYSGKLQITHTITV